MPVMDKLRKCAEKLGYHLDKKGIITLRHPTEAKKRVYNA